jgi:hypothetical protein
MAGHRRRRRGHAARSARILTAGLSSATAFGMVAGMAVTARAGQDVAASRATAAGPGMQDPAAASVPPTQVVIVRRHWATTPGSGATTAPVAVAVAAAPAPIRTSRPRPVARTRGS